MRLLLGPVALLVGCPALLGQQYGFRSYTPQDGLAQSQVRCMAEDADGYLWFGTLGGASRFDGQEFTNYARLEGLPETQVNAMFLARDSTLWLACGGSLASFDGQRMRTEQLPRTWRDQRIVAVAEDPAGALIVGTDGAGLARRSTNGWEPLPGFPTDTANGVRALLMLPDGGLLIGLRNGLLHWMNGSCTEVVAAREHTVSALARSPDGTIWVGTFGDGLIRIAPDGGVVTYDESAGLLQKNIRSLLVDHGGRVWIGSKFGANVIENGRIRSFTVHQGMPNDNIWGLHEDREGNIWLGTDGAGVLRYAGEAFVNYTMSDGLCSDLVMCVVPDQRGDAWLGTYGSGICRMDGMAMLTTHDGSPNNTVWCGVQAADGTLIFGTSNGLCRVVNGVVSPMDSVRDLIGERILSLHLAPGGELWCGTRDRMVIIPPDGPIQRHASFNDVPLRSVRAITTAPDGTAWLATDIGVVRRRGPRVDRWSAPSGLSDNTVFCLLADARGRMWAGTSSGLNCIQSDHTVQVRLGDGFGSNHVGFLIAGPDGRIWAGTNDGIRCFHPDSLLADPRQVEHITQDDGLRGMECNQNAAFRDKEGRLYFGTNGGLVVHDPRKAVRAGTHAPLVPRITGLRSFLLPTDWRGLSDSIDARSGLPIGLDLPYRRNHLTFDYTAIALTGAEELQFQYRLEGFDTDWLPPSESRFTTYSNLPHGDYRFEVRASAGNGRWGPPARFDFRIQAPYWLRWWFFLLCGSIAALVLVAVQRYRHVRRERREKTRQLMLRSRMLQLEQQALNANMNRHFIFNALNSIQYYINRQDRSMANRYLTSFAKLIRRNLDASQNDTVTLHEELSRLELYLMLEHMRFKDQFQYRVEVDPAVDVHHVELPAMMLQPYVENSIWHGILPTGRPGVVTISATNLEDGRVRVRIMDDGIGIERSLALKEGAEGDHISRGIEITKGRADVLRRLHLMDIRITGPEQVATGNGPTGGTVVTIDLPSGRSSQGSPVDLGSGPSAHYI